jgi:hypothetical protein
MVSDLLIVSDQGKGEMSAFKAKNQAAVIVIRDSAKSVKKVGLTLPLGKIGKSYWRRHQILFKCKKSKAWDRFLGKVK